MKSILLALACFLVVSSANATVDCGIIPVSGLRIEASRDNGHPLANTLSITVAGIGSCPGIQLAFMENDNPAYSSILSTLLSVQARGGTVKVVVSSAETYSSAAKRIEYLEFP